MNTMLHILQAALLLLAFTAVAQQQTEVEITSEPSHHLVFSNAFIRVFDVSVAPKATTLVHRHNYDYLFVTLGDSDVTSARVGAAPAKLVLKNGEVRFTPGGFAHAAANNSDRIFRNITIEVLNSSTGEKQCADSCSVSPCKSADKSVCPSVERLLLSDQWTVSSLSLPPGATYEQDTHSGGHLSVAVSDLDLQVTPQNGPATEVHQKIGDIAWHNPTTQAVRNTGPKPATIIYVEFKGAAPSSAPLN